MEAAAKAEQERLASVVNRCKRRRLGRERVIALVLEHAGHKKRTVGTRTFKIQRGRERVVGEPTAEELARLRDAFPQAVLDVPPVAAGLKLDRVAAKKAMKAATITVAPGIAIERGPDKGVIS